MRGLKISIIWILAFTLLLPNAYPRGFCYRIAVDVQNEFGAPMVIVVPLKENGAYDFSKGGHVLNYYHPLDVYIDWQGQWIWNQARFEQVMWYWYPHGWQNWISPDKPPFPIIVK